MSRENEPLVSVIIPVYNDELYISDCLLSVLRQDYHNIEVVCVDDGSTDASGSIIQEVARNDSRVRIIAQENGGLSVARNVGLDAAKGKYVWFVDGDDQIGRTAISKLVEIAEKDGLDQIIFSAEVQFDEEAKNVSYKRVLSYKSYYSVKQDERVFDGVWEGGALFARLVLHDNCYVSVPLRFVRKALLDECHLRFNEGLIREDNYFTPLLILRSRRVRVIKNAFYVRRLRDNSLMTKKGAEMDHAVGLLGNTIRLIEDLKNEDLNAFECRQALSVFCKKLFSGALQNYSSMEGCFEERVLNAARQGKFSELELRLVLFLVIPFFESLRDARRAKKRKRFFRLRQWIRDFFSRKG